MLLNKNKLLQNNMKIKRTQKVKKKQATFILVNLGRNPSETYDQSETSILVSDWLQVTGLTWVGCGLAAKADKYKRSHRP